MVLLTRASFTLPAPESPVSSRTLDGIEGGLLGIGHTFGVPPRSGGALLPRMTVE